MLRGRKPGYKHSEETKNKMRESHTGKKQTESTKEMIRQSKLGVPRSELERKAIADGRAAADLESKCMNRFLEMRSEYPGFEDFFDSNKSKLLYAMRDIKSEKELRDIRKYIETTHLEDVPQACLHYQYDSSSLHAQEDVMVALMDATAFLRRASLTEGKRVLLH